ncbi:hypothetical protein AKJ16_DCAP11764 [Drosera capensis]
MISGQKVIHMMVCDVGYEGLKHVDVEECQKQQNGHFCGLFVCTWAELLLSNTYETELDIYLKRALMAITNKNSLNLKKLET